MFVAFESDVILNRSQTAVGNVDAALGFESDVILNRSQTLSVCDVCPRTV